MSSIDLICTNKKIIVALLFIISFYLSAFSFNFFFSFLFHHFALFKATLLWYDMNFFLQTLELRSTVHNLLLIGHKIKLTLFLEKE